MENENVKPYLYTKKNVHTNGTVMARSTCTVRFGKPHLGTGLSSNTWFAVCGCTLGCIGQECSRGTGLRCVSARRTIVAARINH